MADTPGDGATLYEKRSNEEVEYQRSQSQAIHEDADHGGVDVQRAERQFEELSHQLSDLGKKGDKQQWHQSTHSVASINSIDEDADQGGVDIQRAERQFEELSRQLSIRSNLGKKGDKQQWHQSTHSVASVYSTDLEKGSDPDAASVFDLREYLTSSNDANQQAGIKHKHVGVTWEGLRVDVVGGADSKFYVKTFGNAIIAFFLSPITLLWGLIQPLLPLKKSPMKTILHKSDGYLKSGEMCLVLGCPGAGCSTFLKTIANRREDFGAVSGEVLYAGMDAQEMAKFYKGEVVYNEEDDRHIATLTVGQTLDFALSTKTPGPNGRLPGVSRKEFDKEVQNTLLRMLNIAHTKNTLVGDEFVRGVSGGERKRVSIAEMMATRARVQCWDNSTRGLDASTALDFVKCLRIMTDILGQTTFVTLYQAGEGIYDLFDKVIVLDQGRQVFYGPPTEARAYFEGLGFKSLPRQSTADYLTGCTDPNERQFAPGRSEADVPHSPEALENAFRASKYNLDMQSDRASYKKHMETDRSDQEAFRAAVVADKKKGVSKKSPYTQGFIGQVRVLVKRQFTQRLQDKFQLYTSFGLSTVLALVIGGAFFNLPPTSAGAFTRGSVIFVALLTTCLDAFQEMPMQMLGRPILHKQTNYGMYRPSTIAIANTLADIPFSAVRIFVYNVCVYFMTNLDRSAGGFFTFHLFNWLAFLTMQGFFRSFGLLCTNFDSAFRLATFFIPNFIQYSGYTIPVDSMKRWLFWIYYLNPIAYAWQGAMENEFMRINLSCDGNSIVPRNGPGVDQYPDQLGPNQACTLFGATGGSDLISGSNYISAGYGIFVSDIWKRCFVVLVGFFIAFQITQVIALEYFPQYNVSFGAGVFAKENDETKKLNQLQQEKKAAKRLQRNGDKEIERNEMTNSNEKERPYRKTFSWEKLNYTVPVPGGTRRLLHDVYGYVKPGTLTALMGASGAGKTTCLDVLAQRKNIGVISGDVLVDGRPLSSDFARGTAYAEQMDVHEGSATVREAIRFSAYLRQPASVPEEEKNAYVEEIIELLELQDLSEAMVFSLGVEARKRLTIGVELASKPELLLFLDEPTSGLDAQSAWNLVRFLRKLADQGQAILCTIHQPSSLLFESFDRLLLLERGGETVYFGDIGADSHILRDYFARNGAPCPSNVNPAEFMLEAIGAGVTPRIGRRDWKDIWLDSPEYRAVRKEIDLIKERGLVRPEDNAKEVSTYATSFLYQLKIVVKRNNLALWRMPDYIFTRLFVCMFISLWVSLSFLNLKNSVRDLQFRVFSIFYVSVLPAIIMSQIEPMFINNRRIFIREASSKIYSPYVFALGQLVGEIPYNVLCGIVHWTLMVYPMDFGQGTAGQGGNAFQLLVIIFVILFGISLGQLIAAISPSVQVAVLFNPFIGVVLSTFAGVTIPYPVMEKFWRSWLYELNPYTRLLSAMLSTELHGLPIQCRSDEFAVFSPPSGQTCGQWADSFKTIYGGYIDNPNATADCRYCQYSVGDEFYSPLNIKFDDRWRDVFIIFAFFVFNLIATIIASRLLRFAKR
ncbi:pleiotropic drug resistance abc transporter [Moniliophthora roreri MCA 2997]|uniref:Pleiotropic drug resistance abc transporter n=1 Tax=Moniliophthora roreri (strain MCA 2997) TaxID=1381753 RepID=V2XUD9_MONRO|nr:pleiotropic drug resistance abc transporter [Moniliophthora roreri MCA 2997]